MQKIIFIPGWAGTELLWTHQIHHLQDIAECEVLVLDQEPTLDQMVQRILQTKEEKFSLCGHSIGGWASLAAAIQAPHRIEKLILIGAWEGNSSPQLLQLFQEILAKLEKGDHKKLLKELIPSMIHPSRSQDQPLLEIIHNMHAKFSKVGLTNQTKAEIQGGNLFSQLAQIKCPTLLIHARQDAFFTLEHQKMIQEQIPNAKLIIIEDSGHMMPIENPPAITALVRLWMS